jgi:tetratricopeptide (TPR) repeat protein
MPDAHIPRALIGASIPRSGHHFLQQILSIYYGSELFYCEFYSPPNCCRSIPCTRRGPQIVNYQKNHDRDLSLPTDIPEAQYIIQYRHPVPEALSDRELVMRSAEKEPESLYRRSREHYAMWLARKAIYYRKFHDKWLRSRIPNGIYLDYSLLSADPGSAVRPIVEWVSGKPNEHRLAQTVEKAGAIRVSSPEGKSKFTARVVAESPYFDADLLGPFEDYVLRHCPGFEYQRQLTGRFEGSVIHGLVVLLDDEEPLPKGDKDRLSAAARLTGQHPEVQREAAQRLAVDGQPAAAASLLIESIGRFPHFLPAYRTLFGICRKASIPYPPEIVNDRAHATFAGNAGLLATLGEAYATLGMTSEAINTLTEAIAVDPAYLRANRILANLLMKERRWREALPIAQLLVEVEPENPASAGRLLRIQKKLA